MELVCFYNRCVNATTLSQYYFDPLNEYMLNMDYCDVHVFRY